MQKLKEQLDAKNFAEAEKTADSILETMGASELAATQDISEETLRKLRHDIGGSFHSVPRQGTGRSEADHGAERKAGAYLGNWFQTRCSFSRRSKA